MDTISEVSAAKSTPCKILRAGSCPADRRRAACRGAAAVIRSRESLAPVDPVIRLSADKPTPENARSSTRLEKGDRFRLNRRHTTRLRRLGNPSLRQIFGKSRDDCLLPACGRGGLVYGLTYMPQPEAFSLHAAVQHYCLNQISQCIIGGAGFIKSPGEPMFPAGFESRLKTKGASYENQFVTCSCCCGCDGCCRISC
jgi:hypothetical protein